LKYFLYIIKSKKSGGFYIGTTGNLDDRLRRHNGGYSGYTKSGVTWDMVYTEVFNSRSEALAREKQLKSWKNKAKLQKLIDNSAEII